LSDQPLNTTHFGCQSPETIESKSWRLELGNVAAG
jgi:hypothetical protein